MLLYICMKRIGSTKWKSISNVTHFFFLLNFWSGTESIYRPLAWIDAVFVCGKKSRKIEFSTWICLDWSRLRGSAQTFSTRFIWDYSFTCLLWQFVAIDARASALFWASLVLIVPIAGELSSMKETTPCRMEETARWTQRRSEQFRYPVRVKTGTLTR